MPELWQGIGINYSNKPVLMKTTLSSKFLFIAFITLSFLLTSCAVIGGIFKTGFYAGIFVVLLVVGFVIYMIMRSKSNNTNT